MFATSAHLRGADRQILGGIGRQSRFVATARAAEVPARGPIRGGVQAHLAVARVAEQPTASTPASLPRWTIGSSACAGRDEMTATPGKATTG